MDAFDADVLIFAATPDHEPGRGVRALLDQAAESGRPAGVGSVLLVSEVLIKPRRMGWHAEEAHLAGLLKRLDLIPVDRHLVDVATVLGVRYGLRAADAVHLATAVVAGADRFITGNRKDFPQTIDVVEIAYPEELRSP